MPGLINTRPQSINLDYYPGQTILLTFTFPSGYLATRVLRSFLGGRASPGVELTVTEVSATVLTVAASSSDTTSFDFPIAWELDVFDSPTFTPIFVGTWSPGTDGPVAPVTATYVVRTPDELAVTVTQSSPPGVGGVNGNTILSGTAAPTTEGANGDYYIRTTTMFIYGPKTAGVWGAGQALATGPAGPAGTLADGDKGDITVSASGATWTIDNDTVTYAKMQPVSATDKLLGRSTAGAGDVEEIALTAAGRALLDDANAATQRTTLGLGSAAVADTGTGASNVPTTTQADARYGLSTILAPSSDTYINSQATTTNYDTAATMLIGSTWASVSFCRRALFTFDVSTLAGKTIRQAKLRLVTATAGAIGVGHLLQAREMLRAYVANQVTWDIYSTGNNWGTAGAKNTSTDIGVEFYGDAACPENSTGAEVWVDLSALLRKRIVAGDTTFRFILGFDATGSDNPTEFHSLEASTAAYRPQLEVSYNA